jgi:hypothetical protein
MRDVAEQNLSMWKDMQESFLSGSMSSARKGKRDSDKS